MLAVFDRKNLIVFSAFFIYLIQNSNLLEMAKSGRCGIVCESKLTVDEATLWNCFFDGFSMLQSYFTVFSMKQQIFHSCAPKYLVRHTNHHQTEVHSVIATNNTPYSANRKIRPPASMGRHFSHHYKYGIASQSTLVRNNTQRYAALARPICTSLF